MVKVQKWSELQLTHLKAAEEIAVRAGALSRCPCHGLEYRETKDLRKAIALGNTLLDDWDETVPPSVTREELTDLITYVVENAFDSCQAC